MTFVLGFARPLAAHPDFWRSATHLHGVHGNVDAAVQQGVINLLGEQALAANVGQRLVQDLVARGLDDDDLQRALLVQLGEGRLWTRNVAAEKGRAVSRQRGRVGKTSVPFDASNCKLLRAIALAQQCKLPSFAPPALTEVEQLLTEVEQLSKGAPLALSRSRVR